MFYYYDDNIKDVLMPTSMGEARIVAAGRWYHISLTVADGSGTLYDPTNTLAHTICFAYFQFHVATFETRHILHLPQVP